jgi:nitric oxide reductase NorD protein
MENEVKKTLKRHLKGATSSTVEGLAKRIGILPSERVLLATDIGIQLAGTSLRAAIEFLKAAPEVSRVIEAGDMRVWGDTGRRLSATSADTAAEFFQVSAGVLQSTPESMRSPVLRLASKQAALSASTAVECFKTMSSVIASIGDQADAAQVLNICLELARHSVKHSYDLFRLAPSVISHLTNASTVRPQGSDLRPQTLDIGLRTSDDRPQTEGCALVKRSLALTSAFAFKSGGTAAEFFAELPYIAPLASHQSEEFRLSLEKLFANTETYLERSGGVALQYYKAASRVLLLAGPASFERWTRLATRVSQQGNAASYHFMKASPQIISDVAARAGESRRAEVISAVLEIVQDLGDRNSIAAIECFRASPLALTGASLGQFREWAFRGLEKASDVRRTQAYYGLESKGSQEALFKIEGGLTLDSVAQTLRLYVEGLTGRVLNIAPISSIPEEVRIGDGKTIYLPSVIAEFDDEAENFRLFKVIAAHAAGQIEFETYAKNAPATIAALTDARRAFGEGHELSAKADEGESDGNRSRPEASAARGDRGKAKSLDKSVESPESPRQKRKPRTRINQKQGVDFLSVLSEFPNTDLAMRLFGTIENARVDFLLRNAYRGIRRDLDFVRARLVEQRPRIDALPAEAIPFELLFQVALCGGAALDARRAYPAFVSRIEDIVEKYVRSNEATVADSLAATSRIYRMLVDVLTQSDEQEGEADSEGEEGEGTADSSTASDSGADQPQQSRQQMEVRDDPFSLWASALTQDASPDTEIMNQVFGGDAAEHDLEKGDRAFYYDEWDRELGDYRTRWCRIIERSGARGSRGFVEMVRSRYAGVISSVRYQFQLLRPENLRKIRGEIDGEDYDLQAVIDYALDKRSTGLIDDRLYTRKLRRERDVAVSFLLDMSSSTARTISRYPNKPYTQPGQRIIDIEKEGLVLMSEALEAVGDAYSMQGFSSEGRRNVKFYVIKDFSEHYSAEVERRIGGITYQNNTRLGAAIRHASARLAAREARTKLMIVLSDGRPYDHDYGDSRYAREDTRVALRQTRLAGITPFCITIDRESEDQLKDMYGEVGYTIIDDVLSLPERLPGIYTRLTT